MEKSWRALSKATIFVMRSVCALYVLEKTGLKNRPRERVILITVFTVITYFLLEAFLLIGLSLNGVAILLPNLFIRRQRRQRRMRRRSVERQRSRSTSSSSESSTRPEARRSEIDDDAITPGISKAPTRTYCGLVASKWHMDRFKSPCWGRVGGFESR